MTMDAWNKQDPNINVRSVNSTQELRFLCKIWCIPSIITHCKNPYQHKCITKMKNMQPWVSGNLKNRTQVFPIIHQICFVVIVAINGTIKRHNIIIASKIIDIVYITKKNNTFFLTINIWKHWKIATINVFLLSLYTFLRLKLLKAHNIRRRQHKTL